METSNNSQATDTTLRDVPSDIGEYRKFVEAGGNEHNEKVLGREAAVAAAKAAGIVPDSAPGDQVEEKRHLNRFQRKVARLNQAIGSRDAEIASLRKQLEAHSTNGAPKPNGAAAGPAKDATAKPAAAAGDKTPARPKEEDFKTYGEFVEALTNWTTAKAISERESQRASERASAANDARAKEVIDAHNARVDEAKKRYPNWVNTATELDEDGEPVDNSIFAGLNDNSFSDPMVVYIFESERGPDITYYLATHRDELKRIRALSPVKQAAALGRIEDALPAPEAGDDKDGEESEETEDAKPAKAAKVAKSDAEDDDEDDDEKPQPKRKTNASKAPPPARPIGGKGGADDSMPDPKDFKAYEAWSKRQAAKGVKR